jgi:LuxR family quorum sensing-dependent transcriptional regulator
MHRNLIFDTIDAISRLSSVPQIGDTLADAAAKFGFTAQGITGLGPLAKGAYPIHLTEKIPEGFRELYIQEQFFGVDHIGAHARVAYEPFRYSDAPYDRAQSRRHQRFMQALRTFGLGRGLIVPVGPPTALPACVWMAGVNPALDSDSIRAIHLIALFAASKARALFRPPDVGPHTCILTVREREVLTWAAQGKSAWEIGKILNIVKRTVDEHTRNATRKLGAMNRTHAIVISLRDKIIKF